MPADPQKPAFFYHGSPYRDIALIEPRNEKVRDREEGPVVFATPKLAYAIMFMIPHVESGSFDDVPYMVILGDRDGFIKNDKGGHVYVVPGDTFENDPEKGLGIHEWTSKVPVIPVEVLDYPSVLDAAIENAIQVYFIDEPTYQAILQSDDDGHAILGFLQSENQLRHKNIRDF